MNVSRAVALCPKTRGHMEVGVHARMILPTNMRVVKSSSTVGENNLGEKAEFLLSATGGLCGAHTSQVAFRIGKAGTQAKRLMEMVQGCVQVSALRQCCTEIIVDVGVPRLDAYRGSEMVDGLDNVAKCVQDPGQSVLGAYIARPQAHRRGIIRECLFEPTQQNKRVGEHAVGHHVLRIPPDGLR